jgi:hypothetical protein
VESLFFATSDEIGKKYKGAPGGLRTWLIESKTTDLPAYRTPEVRLVTVRFMISKLAYTKTGP